MWVCLLQTPYRVIKPFLSTLYRSALHDGNKMSVKYLATFSSSEQLAFERKHTQTQSSGPLHEHNTHSQVHTVSWSPRHTKSTLNGFVVRPKAEKMKVRGAIQSCEYLISWDEAHKTNQPQGHQVDLTYSSISVLTDWSVHLLREGLTFKTEDNLHNLVVTDVVRLWLSQWSRTLKECLCHLFQFFTIKKINFSSFLLEFYLN